jgi:hypothetical protein
MTAHPLKVWCTCHAHVWALDPEPATDEAGQFWRLEPHDRPDGQPCPESTRRNEVRVMTADEYEALPAEFRSRVAADARALAVRLGFVDDDDGATA